MQRFDSESSYLRQKSNLEKHYDHWKNIPQYGAVDELLRNQAESFNEVARYGETLLQEKKWDTSLNYSSIAHQAKMVSKKFNRKVSARGYVLVSHTDTEGNNRLRYLGKYFTDINAPSNYDDLTLDEDAVSSTQYALVPWLSSQASYTIPNGTIFTNANGKTYIATQSKTIKALSNSWSTISSSASLYKTFMSNGGWEGIKYLTIPVVEGTLKSVVLGTSTGAASQSFLLNTLNIEAADSIQTKSFLYLEVEDDDTHWEETRFLSDCDGTARMFQLDITDDMSGTTILFGDNVNGKIPTKGKTLTLHYLETNGSEGNVSTLYSMNSEFTIPNTTTLIDPRTNEESQFLSCTNIQTLSGGKDLETLSEYKRNTEVNYRNNFTTIIELQDFIDNIYKVTSVPLDLVKAYIDEREKVVNGTTIEYNALIINAIAVDGSDLSDLDKSEIKADINLYLKPLICGISEVDFEDYNRIIIDSSISIEPDQNKTFDRVSIGNDISSLITNTYSLKNLDISDNNLYSSLAEKLILDNYGAYIKNIEMNNWVRMTNTNISYQWSDSTEINASNNIIWFSFKLNQESFSTSQLIKNYKSGVKIAALINITPPSTSVEDGVTAVIYDQRTAQDTYTISGEIAEKGAAGITVNDNSAIMDSAVSICQDDVTDSYGLNKKFYLAQLNESRYSFTLSEASDSSALTQMFVYPYKTNENSEIQYDTNNDPIIADNYLLDGFYFNFDDGLYTAILGIPLTYFTSLYETYSSAMTISSFSEIVTSYLENCEISLSVLSNDRTFINNNGDLLYIESARVVYE